ncbi:ArpU family phage packaging/lysis transcriptional regulator [Streptococcus suis]|uniref:Putative autolysin regulatory protein arpU n=1 Tax=Streptococcus suis TaxID=1307 RepID=A0A116L168_STRSU|nr:ArpU family phage packaging/lysis transcriptional regulator [Streptococcus suis]NQH47201.1 transcriptional regulator [Streptococcus suis]NQP28230.1 transcriptional regulator [Streptococcus suis]NQP39206.1 transcriptional regulator [Streptococcus suis]CYU66627.1 putative autolysin regulatory protein arpU [Streptococcus suis]
MRLFKEIDKYFTKKNAYEVLELYRRYARMAGEEYTPKLTATYSFEPKSSGFTNKTTEIQVTNRVAACDELEEITKAINRVIDPYIRQILIEKYCKWHIKQDKAIYTDLGYSESEFYRMLERGAIEFAENYRGGELLVFRKFLGDIC